MADSDEEGSAVLRARASSTSARVRHACTVCCRPENLRRTLPIAAVVGIVLTLINELDVFVQGRETEFTWVKVGLNFLVPLCVSNLGVLAGTRTSRPGR